MKNLFKTVFNNVKGNVNINGVNYTGNNISIINGDIVGGDVIVDGVTMTKGLQGNIEVTVIGNCNKVETISGDVTVQGDVSCGVKTMSGDVSAHDIKGGVKTMSGDINL